VRGENFRSWLIGDPAGWGAERRDARDNRLMM